MSGALAGNEIFGVLLGLYFAPSLVAWSRKHAQLAALFVLNLFLGWTIVGWVGALVWALIVPQRPAAPGSAFPVYPPPVAPAPRP